MQRTGTASDRPLFDRSQPHGIVFYPNYRVLEVARITGIGPDKVRSIFKSGIYGKIIRICGQTIRPHRTRNNITLLIPYETLTNLLDGKSEVA